MNLNTISLPTKARLTKRFPSFKGLGLEKGRRLQNIDDQMKLVPSNANLQCSREKGSEFNNTID
jgi:hypothetical protein